VSKKKPLRLFPAPRFIFLGGLDLLIMLLRPGERADFLFWLLIKLARMTTLAEATPLMLSFRCTAHDTFWMIL
jgi:hypothetical protein